MARKSRRSRSITLPTLSSAKKQANVAAAVPEVPKLPAERLTPRAHRILEGIYNDPGYTVPEYAQKLDEYALFINGILHRTKGGQMLIENNMVAVPRLGKKPEWFTKQSASVKAKISRKDVEVFINLPELDENVPKEVRVHHDALRAAAAKMIARPTISPHVQRKRMEDLGAHVTMAAQREAATMLELTNKVKELARITAESNGTTITSGQIDVQSLGSVFANLFTQLAQQNAVPTAAIGHKKTT